MAKSKKPEPQVDTSSLDEPPLEPEQGADRVEVFTDDAGLFRWRRVAPNHRKIATSGEAFHDKHNAVRAAHRANPDTIGDDPEVKVYIEDEDTPQ